jgi:membrane protease YdiL (CAAX protease family)
LFATYSPPRPSRVIKNAIDKIAVSEILSALSILSKSWRLPATLLVLLAYVVARNRIYFFFPAHSLESWFVRDTWMTIPRLACFTAIFCIYSGWKTTRTDWRLSGNRKSLTLGFFPVALWCFYTSGSRGDHFPHQMIFIGAATSAIVGLFEEYAFRGPLLIDLAQPASVLRSIFISAFLFTIYHFQAQSLRSWPAIFLTGITFAGLRFRGVSLAWLVLIHTIIDASYFFFGSQTPPTTSLYGVILNLGLLICSIAASRFSAQETTV